MNFPSSSARSQSVQPARNVKIAPRVEDESVLNSDTYTQIKSLKVGKYRQTFLVQRITHNDSMVTASGSRFARVILKDLSGEIEGVVWNYFHINEGNFYDITLETKFYKGELEFQTDCQNLLPVETPLNVHDYIKGVSESALMAHAATIEQALELMTDEHYQNIIGNAMHRLDLIQALKTSPYGLTGPLAYKGGLLVHVAGSLKLAKVMAEQAKESETPLNISLVIASCLLRNIGWHSTTCFVNGGYLRPKDAYHMTGISRASAHYVEHLMVHVESDLEIVVPEAKKQALENSCNELSDIKTIEGRIAATADTMIDLLHFGGESLQRKQRGNWTEDFFTGHNK